MVAANTELQISSGQLPLNCRAWALAITQTDGKPKSAIIS